MIGHPQCRAIVFVFKRTLELHAVPLPHTANLHAGLGADGVGFIQHDQVMRSLAIFVNKTKTNQFRPLHESQHLVVSLRYWC